MLTVKRKSHHSTETRVQCESMRKCHSPQSSLLLSTGTPDCAPFLSIHNTRKQSAKSRISCKCSGDTRYAHSMVDVSQEVITNSGKHSHPTHSQISAKEEAFSLLFPSHEFSAKRWPRGKFRNKSKSHNKLERRLWIRTPHQQLQSKTRTLNQLRSRD